MQYLLVICATVIILYLMYLIAKASEVYVDEPVERGNYINPENRTIGMWIRYKRTFKNGRITYHEKEYR